MANIAQLKIPEILGTKNLINELILTTSIGKTPVIISDAGLGKQEY